MVRQRSVRMVVTVLLLLGAGAGCSAVAPEDASHPPRVGEAPPADSPLGGAVDSGVAGFARPEGLVLFSKPLRGDPYRTFEFPEGASDDDGLTAWLEAVYPKGEDLGEWTWCEESDRAAMSGGPARRYAHPDQGAITIEVLEDFGYPILMISSKPDGTCDLPGPD